MDLDRPASRSGLHDQRPVTRWRRDERPPSRSGVATEDTSRYMGEDRPTSRRGAKPEPGFHGDRPMTQRSMMMRPPSASAFSSRMTGTSSRLSSALMTTPHTGMGILPAQSSLRERDRLVSQQGVSGLRTGTSRGPASRQVQDKRYFESLLHLKTRELANEVTRLRRQIESDSRDQATYLVYDKRVKEMAAELTDLQGQLSDYNLLVDKINTGTERGEIVAETRELAAANQTEAAALEAVFTDRTRRQTQVHQLEQEIQQERQVAEKLVAGMTGEMLEQYQSLRQDNERLTHQMELLQGQLDALTASRTGLQDQISLSSVKQEAVRLYVTLAELESRRDTLLEEERNRLSPAEERDRLLSRVRQDNAEIASMERASAELKEQIRQAELNLQQVNEELTESQSERHSKYLELRKREETMEEFLATWEATKEAEAARLEELEGDVVATLAAISRRLASLPSPADYLALEQDLASGSRTLDSLTADHAQLALYLNKVEVMEDKVKAQLAALTENLQRMQDEMVRLADLDGLRARAEARRLELNEERDTLLESRGSTIQALHAAREKQTSLEKQLADNETHTQLNNMERKLATLEQNNFSMREFIASRSAESDYEGVRGNVLGLVKDLNLSLRESYKKQS
ncbi:intraflagellar transport protein 74 homolog [Macrosteles quadrilineatus]|uniref:intraflagellar transport protein 74 homolog n=1 Tax=Macrosteles quadrilineatus TaxID=74068 RepID=UPI0023E25BB7|nr:intraflagellar transport protein 74 homolog [Macrosteles quadrilineatus]